MTASTLMTADEALAQIQGRVLLINPPVIDSRYSWIRWNQPLDLLKLATRLRTQQGCDVKLFDFMLPARTGNVPKRQFEAEGDLPTGEQTRWLFGRPLGELRGYLERQAKTGWVPDTVWITTLASFWWQTVPMVINEVRRSLRTGCIMLAGNYSILETHHAEVNSTADMVVASRPSVTQWAADFSLYTDDRPHFCALDLDAAGAIQEVEAALGRDVHHFVFFNEDIFDGFRDRLYPVLTSVVANKWNLEFHGICGAEIRSFPVGYARLLKSSNMRELHFEPAYSGDGTLDEVLYRKVMEDCEQAGLATRRGSGWEGERFSAFLWLGRPDDDLDLLVWNALKGLQLVGMVIPKPYSPRPHSDHYTQLKAQLEEMEPEDVSPHRLVFSGRNGIFRADYDDYYRLTALLNSKVRGHTFDFTGNSYLAGVIRESLRARRWDL